MVEGVFLAGDWAEAGGPMVSGCSLETKRQNVIHEEKEEGYV